MPPTIESLSSLPASPFFFTSHIYLHTYTHTSIRRYRETQITAVGQYSCYGFEVNGNALFVEVFWVLMSMIWRRAGAKSPRNHMTGTGQSGGGGRPKGDRSRPLSQWVHTSSDVGIDFCNAMKVRFLCTSGPCYDGHSLLLHCTE